MDKLDYVLLQSNTSASHSSTALCKSWTQSVASEPLPPFGSLSFDLARLFVRRMQGRGLRTFKKKKGAGDAARPSTSGSAEGHGRRFSPMADLAHSPTKGVFAYVPTMPSAPAYSIAARHPRRAKGETPGPGAHRTAGGFNSLSTSKSAPSVSLAQRTRHGGAVNPNTGSGPDAGVGIPHRPATAFDGPGGWSLKSRPVNLAEKPKSVPGPYTYEDAHQRKLRSSGPVTFGVRHWEPPVGDTPGPKYVLPSEFDPEDSSSDSSEYSSEDEEEASRASRPPKAPGRKGKTFGQRHAHLYRPPFAVPAPNAYDTTPGLAATANQAPAYSMRSRPKTGDVSRGPSVTMAPLPAHKIDKPAFTPMPNLPNAPSFTMGSFPLATIADDGPDPASYDVEPGLRATLRHAPAYPLGVKTAHDTAVRSLKGACPSVGMGHTEAKGRPISFGERHKHLYKAGDEVPGPLSYEDYHDRKLKATAPRKFPKMGARLASSMAATGDSPGPAAHLVPSEMGRGGITFGHRHKHLDPKPTLGPGPAYDTGPARDKNMLRTAPAFSFAPRLEAGDGGGEAAARRRPPALQME